MIKSTLRIPGLRFELPNQNGSFFPQVETGHRFQVTHGSGKCYPLFTTSDGSEIRGERAHFEGQYSRATVSRVKLKDKGDEPSPTTNGSIMLVEMSTEKNGFGTGLGAMDREEVDLALSRTSRELRSAGLRTVDIEPGRLTGVTFSLAGQVEREVEAYFELIAFTLKHPHEVLERRPGYAAFKVGRTIIRIRDYISHDASDSLTIDGNGQVMGGRDNNPNCIVELEIVDPGVVKETLGFDTVGQLSRFSDRPGTLTNHLLGLCFDTFPDWANWNQPSLLQTDVDLGTETSRIDLTKVAMKITAGGGRSALRDRLALHGLEELCREVGIERFLSAVEKASGASDRRSMLQLLRKSLFVGPLYELDDKPSFFRLAQEFARAFGLGEKFQLDPENKVFLNPTSSPDGVTGNTINSNSATRLEDSSSKQLAFI